MDIRDTMHTVGMIFRVIWPSSGDIPKTILEVVLTRPASGLALAVKHRDIKTTDQDALAELVGRLTDINDPPNGVKGEDQLPFWSGFYHYFTTTAPPWTAPRNRGYFTTQMEVGSGEIF
jgi:hypothetical protein